MRNEVKGNSMIFNGMPVFFDPNALEKTSERLFPESKNRSKRIHKKLVKRHGGEFRMRPAIFIAQGRILMHPAHRAEFLARLQG
jgi:hypothetical protein